MSLILAPCIFAKASADQGIEVDPDYAQLLVQLTQKSYKKKFEVIKRITESEIPNKEKILKALLGSELYYRRSDNKIFYLKRDEIGYIISPVVVKPPLVSESNKIESIVDKNNVIKSKNGFKRIKINNKLRIFLRRSIAALQLESPDSEIRKSAVLQIMKKLDESKIEILSEYFEKERDPEVKELIGLAMAVGRLSSDDEKTVLAAIKSLEGNLRPVVRNTLVNIIEETENEAINLAAQKSLKVITTKTDLYEKMETLYFGLSLGSVLVLAGIGLAITFGVMGVINMAHGELIMLGAYTTFVIQQLMPNSIGMSILVAIPAAFVVSGLVGILMERTVIRHLYGRPLETLLATFGISLILQQAVRTIFSPLNKTVITPEWMSGALEINSVLSLTWNRLYIIVFCFMVFFALMAAMKKTSLGLQVRAVSQNRSMARAMGVKSDWVDAITFGLGAGIAGVAGVALSLLTNVGPNLGQAYIIDSFMVVVFGGVGNLWGTLVAGMSLGVVNKIMEPWAGAVLAKILVLVFIILFIQKRPKGLFPQRGRAAED